MHRRAFIAGAIALPVAASLPASALAAPIIHAPPPMTGGVFTGSVAWGATADEMIADLLAQMERAV